jgi:hypothetical protein
LAAWEALAGSGIVIPLQESERIGFALGVDEGIDGIKAAHCLALRSEGPLGASPLAFPFTAPNAVTAQVSIALDIRGETFTVCGGQLSGAAALGLAMDVVRRGEASAMLGGGVTCVEKVFLDSLAVVGVPDNGTEREGACILVLSPFEDGRFSENNETPLLLGYGEGFGDRAMRDAVEACFEDAAVSRREVASIWEASPDCPLAMETISLSGAVPSRFMSPAADLFSASFPMTVAAAVMDREGGNVGPALIVGTDCFGGAAAALVRRGKFRYRAAYMRRRD